MPLHPDTTINNMFHDSTGATYLRILVKDNGDGTLTTDDGVFLFPTLIDWVSIQKRAILTRWFRAEEQRYLMLQRLKEVP